MNETIFIDNFKKYLKVDKNIVNAFEKVNLEILALSDEELVYNMIPIIYLYIWFHKKYDEDVFEELSLHFGEKPKAFLLAETFIEKINQSNDSKIKKEINEIFDKFSDEQKKIYEKLYNFVFNDNSGEDRLLSFFIRNKKNFDIENLSILKLIEPEKEKSLKERFKMYLVKVIASEGDVNVTVETDTEYTCYGFRVSGEKLETTPRCELLALRTFGKPYVLKEISL